MRQPTPQFLKSLRRAVSLVVLVFSSALFLDLNGELPQGLFSGVLFFQFLPSLLNWITTGAPGALGFVLVLGLTLFAGRIYCSFLCPLGGAMDGVHRAGSFFKKTKKRYSQPGNLIGYFILFICLVSLTTALISAGSMAVINLLDPYSNFGRIMAVLAKPCAVFINNGLAKILALVDLYWIMPVKMPGPVYGVVFPVLGFSVGLVLLTFFRGRLFCNTLCPVGIFLGLVSRASLFRLSIDPHTCNGCGKCEGICRAQCVDAQNKIIDFNRCIACYACLDICPQGSIGFSRAGREKGESKEKSSSGPAISRRAFMALCALFAAGFHRTAAAANAAVTRPVVYVKNKIPVIRKYSITPPGSLSRSHFTSRCTACHLCVTACPGHVIQPRIFSFGGRGVLMPEMVNSKGFCNFKCTRCGEICPTGAILPLTREAKQETQIGKVVFIRENCIVVTQNTECGACSEHCPTKAVTMEKEKGVRVPRVHPDICVGCGACEYACPSLPHKSIYVEGHLIHLKANKPKVAKPQGFDPDQGFGF